MCTTARILIMRSHCMVLHQICCALIDTSVARLGYLVFTATQSLLIAPLHPADNVVGEIRNLKVQHMMFSVSVNAKGLPRVFVPCHINSMSISPGYIWFVHSLSTYLNKNRLEL